MGDALAAVEADLAEIAKRDPKLAKSALAAIAKAMAKEVDATGNSATSKSMCAGRMYEAIERLRELAPEQKEADKLDDLSTRRADRRKRAAGT